MALVVAGVLLSAGFGAAMADLRASRRAADLQTASVLAEDLLSRAALAPREQLVEWTRGFEGRFDTPMERFSWRIIVRPVEGEDELLGVHMEVLWDAGRYALVSRIAPSPDHPDAAPAPAAVEAIAP